MARNSLFQPAKDKVLAKNISIKSPNAFEESVRVVSKGGLSLKEQRALVLAKNRAKAQLSRKNLSSKERKQFRAISRVKIK